MAPQIVTMNDTFWINFAEAIFKLLIDIMWQQTQTKYSIYKL